MPLTSIYGYRVPELNQELWFQYWPALTALAQQRHWEVEEVQEAMDVEATLRECFRYLEDQFMARIAAETRVSFYTTVHRFHESTTALVLNKPKGSRLPVDNSNFAGVRRALKLILEQGCANDLRHSENYDQELLDNLEEYVTTIDHLVFLGYWANALAGYISRVQLFPGAIGLRFEPQGLDIVWYEPFGVVNDYVEQDMHKHGADVVVQDTFQELKNVFKDKLGIDYDNVTGFLSEIPEKLSLAKPQQLFDLLLEQNYDPTHLTSFFAGLTLSRDNKLSFGDCIYRSQDIRRYIYRPILSLQVEGAEYWLVGTEKWREGLSSLVANAIPFGVCPVEWLAYEPVKKFVEKVRDGHDKVLERPLATILAQRGLTFEANVKAIRNGKQTVSLVVPGVGEMDLLFIDPQAKTVYVGECKHNRSRFDAAGWRLDYQRFVRDYERKLAGKVAWATQHLVAIAAHFSFTTKQPVNLTGYRVEGIFLINAPTLYMYDGPYRTFTISAFRRLVNGHYRQPKIRYTPPGQQVVHLLARPYFKQAAAILAATIASS